MGIPFSTQTGSVKIIERFGRFKEIARPGLGCLICPCFCVDAVAGSVSMRVQQVDVRCETKTRDNVFVGVEVSVQFKVIKDKIKESFYELSDIKHQIRSYIFDVIRSEVPKVKLDDLFLLKEKLAEQIKNGVGEAMNKFGFEILATPITDIDPDPGVKAAMNEINKQERLKKAANDKGEAHKILLVKQAEAEAQKIRIEAEADADAKELAGNGLSRQRQAIVDGLQKSVNAFTHDVEGVNPNTVMDMIMITQYFDTVRDIGANTRTNAIFVPYAPGAVSAVGEQLRQGIMEAVSVNPSVLPKSDVTDN